MFLKRSVIWFEWDAGAQGQMEFYFSSAPKIALCVDAEVLPVAAPAFRCQQSRRACLLTLQMHQKAPDSERVMRLPLERGMGRLEGLPPPLVIDGLFCFASLVITIRICWHWRLSVTRTCRVNRMSKKHIMFGVRILRCPRLCSFQRRTSMNCKPWHMQEGTCNNVLWRENEM